MLVAVDHPSLHGRLLRLELHAILIVHGHQLLTIHPLQGFPAKLKHGTFYIPGVCSRVTWHWLT